MKAQFKLDIRETFDGNLMVKELRDPDMSLPFDECISITILTKKTSVEETIVKAFIHSHEVTDVINKFKISSDGRYIVTHAIVPTAGWLNKQIALGKITDFSNLYVYSGSGLAQYLNGQYFPADLNTLDNLPEDSTVQVIKKETFVLYDLWQCYLNYCKKLFESECSQTSSCDNGCDDELTKNRNLIWVFLNTIQYLMKLGRPDEAQKLLEEISGGCNTLCSNEMFSKNYDCGCG